MIVKRRHIYHLLAGDVLRHTYGHLVLAQVDLDTLWRGNLLRQTLHMFHARIRQRRVHTGCCQRGHISIVDRRAVQGRFCSAATHTHRGRVFQGTTLRGDLGQGQRCLAARGVPYFFVLLPLLKGQHSCGRFGGAW